MGTPAMAYGLLVEEGKARRRECERAWKSIRFGCKRYAEWVDKETEHFAVCDAVTVRCMLSIMDCVDHTQGQRQSVKEKVKEEVDFEYQVIDDGLLEIWQYDISRIMPLLQECLDKAD